MKCPGCGAKRGLFARCTLGCVRDPRTFSTIAGIEARARHLAHGKTCTHCTSPATQRGYLGEAVYPLCGEHAAIEGQQYDYLEEITAIVVAPDFGGIAYRGGAP